MATRPHYRKRTVFVEDDQETRRFRGLRALATGRVSRAHRCRVSDCHHNRGGQMRLPDFTDDAGLLMLRRSMGADVPGSFSPSYRPDKLTLAELELLATDGKDVSIDDVVVLEDGTLSYKSSRVLVYIRDVAFGLHHDNPRFHVADCATLRRMREINRFGRYGVATRDDGRVLVNRV